MAFLPKFLGGKTQKKLPAPEKTGREKLAEHFRAAVFGHTFRTLSFEESKGVSVHLRAVALKPDCWRVMRVAEGNLLSENGFAPGEQSNQARDGMSLFEAADYLAAFEKAQIENGAQVTAPDKAVLGPDHYEAFCRREGLAIDLLGLPHPTAHGEIVTSGKFPPGEADAARKAFMEREKKTLKIEIVLPAAAMQEGGAQGMTTSDIARWEKDLNKRSGVMSEAHIVLVYAALLLAFDFGEKKIRPRFVKKSPVKDKLIAWGFDETDLLMAEFLAFFEKAEKIHEMIVKYPEKIEEGCKADVIYAAQYYYNLARAHHYFSRRSRDGGMSDANASFFLGAIETAKEMLRKTGAKDEDVPRVDHLATLPQAGEFPKELLAAVNLACRNFAEERKKIDQAKKSFVARLDAPATPVAVLPSPKSSP